MHARGEAGFKYGTERHIGAGELWIPLKQGPDRVLYADIRLMGDNKSNREGNIGLGYRQIVTAPVLGRSIAGGHVWIDRRRTGYGSTFHQVTAGGELLDRDWDARANVYVPLNDERTHTASAPNGKVSDPYLSGSGIFYNVGGRNVSTLTEEPQPGADIELGRRIPVFEDRIDALRIYAGGYHFQGDKTGDVTGWRMRLAADLSPAVSIGGRVQRDAARGSQGFLEAAIRFPFRAKKSFRDESLRARLDESPERDVDIVSGSRNLHTEEPPQQPVPVLAAATGQAQRVLHVDNTAAPGGDGSETHPFNTLKGAEAVLQDHDIVYLHRGDGTASGQNQGIVISKADVALIGSGVDFVYDDSRFATRAGNDLSGTVIAARTQNPVITNAAPTTDIYTGNGILATNDNTFIAGLTVDGATRAGINLLSEGGNDIESFTVQNVTVQNSTDRGLRVDASGNGSEISAVTVQDSSFLNNLRGISVVPGATNANGRIDNVTIQRNVVSQNRSFGIQVTPSGSGQVVSNVTVSDNVVEMNSASGIIIWTTGTNNQVSNVVISGNQVSGTVRTGSNGQGINILANGGSGSITDARIENNESHNNGGDGISAFIDNTAGNARMDNLGIAGNLVHNNGTAGTGNGDGIWISTGTGAGTRSIGATVEGNTVYENTFQGIQFVAGAASAMSVSASGNAVRDNQQDGFYIDDNTTGTFSIDLGGGTLGSPGNNGIHGNGASNPAAYHDLLLDLDNGTVSAKANWWGQAGGPVAGQIANEGACPACGTADTSSALNSDPY